MTMRDRLKRTWARVKAWWAHLWHRDPWTTPPKDLEHANYRKLYTEALPMLATQGQTPQKASELLLYKAQLETGLHNYGDHPHDDYRPQTLFGGAIAAAGGSLTPWLYGGLAVFALGGWGLNWTTSLRLGHAKHDLAVAVAERDREHATALDWEAQFQTAHTDSIANAQSAAHQIETERARANAAAAREARRQREIQSIIHGDAPPWSLRDAPAADAAPSPASGSPTAGHS